MLGFSFYVTSDFIQMVTKYYSNCAKKKLIKIFSFNYSVSISNDPINFTISYN